MTFTRAAFRPLAALLAIQLGACFPAVLHGPRVEQGLAATATISTSSGPTYTEGDAGGLHVRNPPVGVGLGYGWRAATPTDVSLYAALHVPVGFPLTQVDLYAQAPEAWTGRTAGGVGVNLAIDHVAPYLQWGMVNERGSGWSISQGVSYRTLDGTPRVVVAYMPGVALHLGSGQPAVHLFATGAFGRLERSCSYPRQDGSCTGERLWALLTGVTIEARRRPGTSR